MLNTCKIFLWVWWNWIKWFIVNENIRFSFQEDKENGEAEKEKTDETTEPTADAKEINSTGDSLPEAEPMEAWGYVIEYSSWLRPRLVGFIPASHSTNAIVDSILILFIATSNASSVCATSMYSYFLFSHLCFICTLWRLSQVHLIVIVVVNKFYITMASHRNKGVLSLEHDCRICIYLNKLLFGLWHSNIQDITLPAHVYSYIAV